MKTENRTQLYTTLDVYQSAFLTLKGYTPRLVDQEGKIVFVFTANDALMKALEGYNTGGIMVDVSRFVFAVKSLKGQVHSLRRSDSWQMH